MRARNWLERRHALELALKRALAFERAAINNLHRAKCPGEAAGQPDFAVRAAPDHAQHFVVGNERDFRGSFVGDERDFTQSASARQSWVAHASRVSGER